ncbi:hypothetical protein K470DRAFT_258071 [Piedraia hortae CBS 480.64]|uniref:RRM domain-containing protein n=1 Tax=Piedraia hortae CBS 480.64 TaxID=1314780 RepID=A0A6A7C060_9PEZI|nr:hypothetical protein K470DRAFT_258071 [Piedraia hortae CBS 480.64]
MSGFKNKAEAEASLNAALEAERRERKLKLAQDMLGKNPQKLAQELLGKDRRGSYSSNPGMPLSSRAGIAKRNNSQRYPRSPGLGRADSNFGSNSKSGMNIRGASRNEPWIVQASNFAPGTTASDIESVMQGVGGRMKFCRVVSASPTVVAEMGFESEDGANEVVATFNNKKADGRTLHVRLLNGSQPPARQEPKVYNDDMDLDDRPPVRDFDNRPRDDRPRYDQGSGYDRDDQRDYKQDNDRPADYGYQVDRTGDRGYGRDGPRDRERYDNYRGGSSSSGRNRGDRFRGGHFARGGGRGGPFAGPRQSQNYRP